MTQTRTKEQVLQAYKKGNKTYRASILKKYGVSNIDRLSTLLDSKSDTNVSKTELASLLLEKTEQTIIVSFQKQLKVDDVYNSIMNSYHSSTPTTFSYNLKNSLSQAINGVERVVEGFHTGKLDKFGRLYMTETSVERDLSRTSDNRTVLVTLTNLNYIIVNGVKYTKKD